MMYEECLLAQRSGFMKTNTVVWSLSVCHPSALVGIDLSKATQGKHWYEAWYVSHAD